MICFAKNGLTQDLYKAQKQLTCYRQFSLLHCIQVLCDTCTGQKQNLFLGDKPLLLVSEDVTYGLWLQSQSQSYIKTDGQSVSLSWHQAPIWDPWPIFHLLSLITSIFRQFRFCLCGVPSLTGSRVCSFQFLLGIASAVFLRSKSHGTHEHIS
jgi:hypothetical protein